MAEAERTSVRLDRNGSKVHAEVFLLKRVGDEVKRQSAKCSRIFCSGDFTNQDRRDLLTEIGKLESQLLEMAKHVRLAREGLARLQPSQFQNLEGA